MQKNKVKKVPRNRIILYLYRKSWLSPRFIARMFVLNIPTLTVLCALYFLQEISIQKAFLIFGIIFVVTAVITAFVFKELENFISYLKKLAMGIDAELPRFHRGIFGSFRLADTFLKVKNMWSNQTISDASIIEGLPDPLLMINENTNIVFANGIARDFFGEDILHSPIKTIFNDETFTHSLNRIISEKSKAEWFDFDYVSGQTYSFRTRIERLPAIAKNNATMVIVMHDITPFKLFKQQQADFFANASHELKTPLSILSGFIETLQGPAKDDEAAREKFLKMMGEQTARMTHLVKDLLNLSRLQMMEKTHQNDVILIPDLLQGVIEGLSLKAANHHKKLDLKILHELPRVIGNRSELHQVFQNLIDNAIKYGAQDSVVNVKAQLSKGFPKKSDRYFEDMRQVIAISVHNTGEAISPHNLTRIFERFYRIDSLKSRQAEGTGLGLGIVQQIVQKHDGVIDVASTQKDGTTFTVYLPIDF